MDRPGWRVVVLSGGDSPEREVSLRSGASVAAALESAGHTATLVDPRDCPLHRVSWSDFDACFVALHGGAGEDGRVQQELERLGVPYTGSGPQASRLAMSKSASKERFLAQGVRTLPYALVDEQDDAATALGRVADLDYPLVVKPDGGGSSIGVRIVQQADELPTALTAARACGGACLIERFVEGREFTVAMIDDRPLPLVEIVTPERLFSYEAKYHSSLTECRFDFPLARNRRWEIVHAAAGAAAALGTSGLARVDLMLGRDGRAWVLEVNTLPGLTVRSLAPLAAARAGLDMPALCDLLVRRCLCTVGAP